jgi:dTMP kinase
MSTEPQLIVIDGPDGSGKTTQVRRLHEALQDRGIPVSMFRDPGDTDIGEAIREQLLSVENREMTPTTETFLYMASRAQLVEEKIHPALSDGDIVLLDRFYYSTAAYQGIAGNVGLEDVLDLARVATGGLEPDQTVILDVPAEVGLERIPSEADRMEEKGLEFHRNVRQAFLQLADRFDERTTVIDATQPADDIHAHLLQVLDLA